jgi:V/A-type H+-transporting ATPase subunit I
MKKVTIILHENYLNDVISKLHEHGLVQITTIEKKDQLIHEGTQTVEIPPDAALFSGYELRLSKLIDILARTKTYPSGIKAMLNPPLTEPKTVTEHTDQEIITTVEQVLQTLEKRLLTVDEHIKQIKEQTIKNEELQTHVSLLQDFDVDLADLTDSSTVVITTGKTSNFPHLQQQIGPQDEITVFSKQYGSKKKPEWAIILAAHSSEKEKIDKLSREYLTVFDFKGLSGSPLDMIHDLQQKQDKTNEELESITSGLSTDADEHLAALYALREQVQLHRARKEIMKHFTQTQTTYVINGWVLAKNQETLQALIDTTCDGYSSCTFNTPSSNPDFPPTYLETPKWARTFKTFLSLFAIPKYGEINPTMFIGIFFIIFFGLMLGDAGYGLSILILSLLGYFILGKRSPFIKNYSFLGIWLGVSTTIIGFLLNSFFGDFIPRFFYHDPLKPLYNITVAGVHLPLDSLGDPLTVLVIALLCGLVHLNFGLVLGMIQSAKHKQYKLFFTQHFAWIPIQIGGGILIGLFILKWQVDTLVLYSAVILTILGLLLFFFHAGPIGFFGITGYVGDWLSYSRLLALGLATSGMALAFNVVAELIPGLVPVVGVVIFPIMLVILHTANLGIQSLGAAVHSLRLQYVEFFNRFYEGGGEEFSPFQMTRRYTKVEK